MIGFRLDIHLSLSALNMNLKLSLADGFVTNLCQTELQNISMRVTIL